MTAGEIAVPGASLDLSVENFALCEVRRGMRLIGAPVNAPTAYLVIAGEMHLALPGRPGVVARQGTIVLLPAGLQPSIAPMAGPAIDVVATRSCLARHEGMLVFDAAHGGAGDLRVLVGGVSTSPPDLFRGVTAPIVDDLRGERAARAAYAALLAELQRPKPGASALAAALIKTCVVLFARRFAGRPQARRSPAAVEPHARLAGVASFVLARPADPHSVDSLAEMAGMSRSTFARRFADAMGTSPMEFVLKAKLRHAASLLTTTAMSVKQIAAVAGFASRSHFSRAFRAEYGIDPRGFRATRANDEGPAMFFGGAGDRGDDVVAE